MSKPWWINRLQAEVAAAMINPKRDTSAQQGKGNLSFAGNGRVSVSVASVIKSDQVKKQVAAVRELAKFIQAKRQSK